MDQDRLEDPGSGAPAGAGLRIPRESFRTARDPEGAPASRLPAAPALARVRAVGTAFPPHSYSQEELTRALLAEWGDGVKGREKLETFHRNVRVGRRHLALPLGDYARLRSFQEKNDAFIRCAADVGEAALRAALDRAGLRPEDVDHLFFATVTGLATPSIDARLVNRLGLRPDVKRTPIFGLGCVAGAAGLARAADYVKAWPDEVAVLLAVELCSLTVQWNDVSVRNFIATGLFGDGAAAVVVEGVARGNGPGPRVLATQSVFYPGTEDVMGWDIGGEGLRIVLSAAVPDVVRAHARADVEAFLGAHGLAPRDIGAWICHPGGPKVLEALEESLGLDRRQTRSTWESLEKVGNLSSASVLLVLDGFLREQPPPGTHGIMLAMGPGFCSELVLLRW